MIRFFRQIRQGLLTENRFRKYLLYAVGEILLVVIGILIALQINNWNEASKDRAFEKAMLLEVVRALEADMTYFARMSRRLGEAEQTSQVFLKAINEGIEELDGLRPEYRKLYIGIQYEYNPGPYEAIKAAGLDRIASDTLRNALIAHYDFNILRNRDLVNWAERNYNEQVDRLKAFYTGTPEIVSEEDRLEVQQQLPEDLLTQDGFVLLLDDISDRCHYTNRILQPMLKEMDALLRLIKNEMPYD